MTTSATITIPAGYLEDVRSAAIAEVASDSRALHGADAADRGMSELILRRSTRLLNAAGDVELSAESDNTSSPLVHVLEGLIRLLEERLREAAQYGPLPMGDVIDIAAELRWAAEEAIRMLPQLATRLTPRERKAVA